MKEAEEEKQQQSHADIYFQLAGGFGIYQLTMLTILFTIFCLTSLFASSIGFLELMPKYVCTDNTGN